MNVILRSKDDFDWHCRKLDANSKYLHRHNGEPEQYPCKVESNYWDDPNGPYTYDHTFTYKRAQKCCECGHEAIVWADTGEPTP